MKKSQPRNSSDEKALTRSLKDVWNVAANGHLSSKKTKVLAGAAVTGLSTHIVTLIQFKLRVRDAFDQIDSNWTDPPMIIFGNILSGIGSGMAQNGPVLALSLLSGVMGCIGVHAATTNMKKDLVRARQEGSIAPPENN